MEFYVAAQSSEKDSRENNRRLAKSCWGVINGGDFLCCKSWFYLQFCIVAEMIISDSWIARFERYVSFETAISLQNPALRWELGVPDKLPILSSFLGLTDLFEEMMWRISCALRCPKFLHKITIAWALRILSRLVIWTRHFGRASKQINIILLFLKLWPS